MPDQVVQSWMEQGPGAGTAFCTRSLTCFVGSEELVVQQRHSGRLSLAVDAESLLGFGVLGFCTHLPACYAGSPRLGVQQRHIGRLSLAFDAESLLYLPLPACYADSPRLGVQQRRS